MVCLLVAQNRSFIKILSISGPTIDPLRNFNRDRLLRSKRVPQFHALLTTRQAIQIVFSSAMDLPSLRTIKSCGSISNVFDKSKETKPIVLWLSRSFHHWSLKFKCAESQPWNLRNVNINLWKMSWSDYLLYEQAFWTLLIRNVNGNGRYLNSFFVQLMRAGISCERTCNSSKGNLFEQKTCRKSQQLFATVF